MAIDFERDHATHRANRDFGNEQAFTGQVWARCHPPNSQASPADRPHIQVTTGNRNPSPFNCCSWLHAQEGHSLRPMLGCHDDLKYLTSALISPNAFTLQQSLAMQPCP